jgi:hypothetical protein
LIRSQILFQKSAIGSTALSVISDDFNAAITAIHKIQIQNNCNSIVQKDHLNHKAALFASSAELSARAPDNVNDIHQRDTVAQSLLIIHQFHDATSFSVYLVNQVHATNKNTNQNANAHAT